MLTGDSAARPVAVLAVCILMAVPIAGCVSPTQGGETVEDGPASAPSSEAADQSGSSLTLSVERTNATAVTLGLRARPDDVTLGISWWPTDPPAMQGSRTVAGNLSELPVRNLAPNRTYRFRARALGANGEITSEEVVEVRTDPFPWVAPDDAVVRPGMGLLDPGCTLGFILTSSTNASVYALTAGHCFEEGSRGDPVTVDTGPFQSEIIGEVAAYEDTGGHLQNWTEDDGHEYDWGLVRIRSSFRWRTSPMILNVTGPTGIADALAMERGDRVCWEGATGWFQTPATHQYSQRCGAFAGYEQGNDTRPTCEQRPVERCFDNGHGGGLDWFSWYGFIGAGDSGSPVVEADTGEALGVITNANIHQSPHPVYDGTAEGPTLASILDRAAERGWHLRLAQAGYREPAGWTG